MNNKQKMGTAIGVVAVSLVGIGLLMTKQAPEVELIESKTEVLKKTKKLTIKENSAFLSATGEDLTGEDMKAIFEEAGNEKPVYWSVDSTVAIPTDYETTLIGYIEKNKEGDLTYSKFDKTSDVEADADRIENWKVIGDKSETKGGVLTIVAEFKDSDATIQDVQAQAKGIFEITDNLNEKKTYETKVLNIDGAKNTKYVVDEKHDGVTKTITSFK